ncbi:MAG: hypothetical protein ACP5HU_10280 [Phycisphaerae bacterium]
MNIKAELAALEKMSTGELAERYADLTDQPVRTWRFVNHRPLPPHCVPVVRLMIPADGPEPSVSDEAVASGCRVDAVSRPRRHGRRADRFVAHGIHNPVHQSIA